MKEALYDQIVALKNAPVKELQRKYGELFNTSEAPTAKAYLIKKIANKLQEAECGGLSNEAKTKIMELTEKYDPINNKTLRPQVFSSGKSVVSLPFSRDKRLPIPGTVIHKKYKGQDINVKICEKGFEYKDKYYRTLSAVAYEVTSCHWNGYLFFNI